MHFERVLVLAATSSLLVGLSQAQEPAAKPSPSEQVLLCVAKKNSPSIGTAKLVRPSAVDRHLARGACRIASAVPAGSACDAVDPDGDDVCGSDGATCGDGHGPGGIDNPCLCGETVATHTRLGSGFDPVAATACAGDGLVLGAGIQLDLAGITLTGTDSGNGLLIAHGGEVLGGTVAGFGTGIRVLDATPGTATRVAGTLVEGNAGDGVVVDLADPASRAALENLVVQGNGDDGVHVLGGPGVSNLDVAGDTFTPDGYGLTIYGPDSRFRSNGGHGLHFGDPAQVHDVAAFVDRGAVNGNVGNGVRVEQKSVLAQGADCGASAGYPGCTGVTLHGLRIHSNAGAGVELRSGFIIPRSIDTTHYGFGFSSNEVYHNAQASADCLGVQTEPQIKVTGPVGLGNAACAAATDEAACVNANSPVNQHCFWMGTECRVTWDLRGAEQCGQATANPNQIHSYNTNDAEEFSVGLYASGGAIVWVDNNSFRTNEFSKNVDQSDGGLVILDVYCGGIFMNCLAPTEP